MLPIGIEQAMRSLAWLGLVHGLWLGLAAPSMAALLIKFWPNPQSPARHRFLLGAFLLSTIGPFVMAAAHREAARRSTREPIHLAPISVTPGTGIAARQVAPREPGPSAPVRPNVRARVARMAHAARPWVLACWATGLAGMAGLVVLAFASTIRLVRQCRPAPEPVEREARRLAWELGLRRCPPVLVHESLDEPCLCGLMWPSVVLPAEWLAGARPGLVAAVLAHELAHARRRDPLANLAQWFLEALVLFHPGARRLSRALRLQREYRADALAVRLTGDARALAEALEGFARIRVAPRMRGPLGVSLGGEDMSLLPRIQEILGMKSEPARIGLWPVVALPAAALLALAVSSSGLAWEEPLAMATEPLLPEAAALPADGKEPDDPQISYEVDFLVADDLAGFDFDFVAGDDEEPVRVGFASDLERHLLVESILQSPVGWMLRAPKVTTFEGEKALIRIPHEPGLAFDEDAPETSVELAGTLNGKYVRIVIQLAEENLGEARPGSKEDAVREVTCVVPSGGTLVLGLDDPALAALRGWERLILVTPRGIVQEEEEEPIGRPEAIRNAVPPPLPRTPTGK